MIKPLILTVLLLSLLASCGGDPSSEPSPATATPSALDTLPLVSTFDLNNDADGQWNLMLHDWEEQSYFPAFKKYGWKMNCLDCDYVYIKAT